MRYKVLAFIIVIVAAAVAGLAISVDDSGYTPGVNFLRAGAAGSAAIRIDNNQKLTFTDSENTSVPLTGLLPLPTPTPIPAGATNQVFGMKATPTAGFEWKTLTGTSNQVTVTHSAGAVTLSTPQSIGTASAPQFARVGLGKASESGHSLVMQAISQYGGVIFRNSTPQDLFYLRTLDAGLGRLAITLYNAGTAKGELDTGGTSYWSGGNFGIGDTTPAALFTVGSGDKFQVDSSGNVTIATGAKLKGGHTDVIHYQDIPAASNTAYYSNIAIQNDTFVPGAQPGYPRQVRLYWSGGGGGTAAVVTINGTDADGKTISQVWTGQDADTGFTLLTNNAYALITNATVSGLTGGSPPYAGTVQIGSTDVLGLPNYPFSATTDVFKATKNGANLAMGTISATYGTVDCATISAGDDIEFFVRPYK